MNIFTRRKLFAHCIVRKLILDPFFFACNQEERELIAQRNCVPPKKDFMHLNRFIDMSTLLSLFLGSEL